MLSENCIISFAKRHSKNFIGDDAAALPRLPDKQYVISKDILIENVHFRVNYFSANDLAHKVLHANLSDLAAMGATPIYILCGISIPPHLQQYAHNMMKHLVLLCKKNNLTLIGGDTTKSLNDLCISITAIGIINDDHIKRRNTANVSDILCLIGHTGYAHLGFVAMEQGVFIDDIYRQAFLCPNAKIIEGIWIGQQSYVTSMIDISDGLYVDLTKICKASNVACVIDLEQLLKEPFVEHCKNYGIDPIDAVCVGGEDYSLLFTVKVEEIVSLEKRFFESFGYHITRIGCIVQKTDSVDAHMKEPVSFFNGKVPINPKIKPFTHFGEQI